MKNNNSKKQHGGARKGAGRKESGREPWLTRIKPNLKKQIVQRAKEQKRQQCEVLEDLILWKAEPLSERIG